MSDFTPGPWLFDDEHEEVTSEARRRKGLTRIATVNLGWSEPFNSEQNANARLIAAAPDLLDELLSVLDWAVTERSPLREQEIESIRKVIAKATGEQP